MNHCTRTCVQLPYNFYSSRYREQSGELRFSSFVFGPLVMRTCHLLNKPDFAYELFIENVSTNPYLRQAEVRKFKTWMIELKGSSFCKYSVQYYCPANINDSFTVLRLLQLLPETMTMVA